MLTTGNNMKKGFLADKDGNIKSSWIWINPGPCPFPDPATVSEGDIVYQDASTPHDTFHDDFLVRLHERGIEHKTGMVHSKNSGRAVLNGKMTKR